MGAGSGIAAAGARVTPRVHPAPGVVEAWLRGAAKAADLGAREERSDL
jgi:hypothetical protein